MYFALAIGFAILGAGLPSAASGGSSTPPSARSPLCRTRTGRVDLLGAANRRLFGLMAFRFVYTTTRAGLAACRA